MYNIVIDTCFNPISSSLVSSGILVELTSNELGKNFKFLNTLGLTPIGSGYGRILKLLVF